MVACSPGRGVGRAVLAEPHSAVKVSTVRPSSEDLFRMPLFVYRCPKTGYRVQGFVAEDTSEDQHVYEPVTCPACNQIHHVNPNTGVALGERTESSSK